MVARLAHNQKYAGSNPAPALFLTLRFLFFRSFNLIESMHKFSTKDFQEPFQLEVYEALKAAEDGGMTIGETFSRWVSLFYMAQKQASIRTMTGKIDEELEAQFIFEQKKAKHPEAYAEASFYLIEALEANPTDFLGKFAAIVGRLDANLGQFYTPTAISRLMNEVVLGGLEPNPDRRFKISEPSSGSGSTLIEMIIMLKGKGFLPWHYYVEAIDISMLAYQMCFIHLNLLGAPAVVCRGDTLKGEIYDEAVTLALALHPMREDKKTESAMDAETETIEALKEAEPPLVGGQMDFNMEAVG